MPDTMVDAQVIKDAVRLACRAPSLHNSQPWRWIAVDGGPQLFVDRGRVLPSTDRSAREASTVAIAEESDMTSMRSSTDAIALPLQQLTREAEALAAALRDASGVAGSQQSRIQDLAVAANALARNAARSTAALAAIRVGASVTAETLIPEPAQTDVDAEATAPPSVAAA